MDTILNVTVVAMVLLGTWGAAIVYGFTAGYGKGSQLALRIFVAMSSIGFVLGGASYIYRNGFGTLGLWTLCLATALPIVLRRELLRSAKE